jgi:type IV secretory pathway TraG/TraD family ATPase VirD4
MEIEQVWLTLYYKRSWSKHVDTTVAKMGISLSIIKCGSALLTTLSTRQVLQARVLLHLDYCSVVWSGTTKMDLGKLQNGSEQGSTAGPWVYTEIKHESFACLSLMAQSGGDIDFITTCFCEKC